MSSSPGTSDLPAPPYRVVAVDDHPNILSGVELLLNHALDSAWLGSAATPAADDIFHLEQDDEIKQAGGRGNNNVTFVESLAWFNHEWRFCSGCADSWVASASCRQGIGP